MQKHRYLSYFRLRMCFSPQRRAIFGHLNVKKCSEHLMFCSCSRPNSRFATAACIFWTSELQKVLQTPCFVHFHFHICVWPQRRAIFRHQTFKRCSKHLMLCAFSFPHVLFATAACIFSTSELQKVLPP